MISEHMICIDFDSNDGKPYKKYTNLKHVCYYWDDRNLSDAERKVFGVYEKYLIEPTYGYNVKISRPPFIAWQIPILHDLFDDNFKKALESNNLGFLLTTLQIAKDRNVANLMTILKSAKGHKYEEINTALKVIKEFNKNQITRVIRVLMYESCLKLNDISTYLENGQYNSEKGNYEVELKGFGYHYLMLNRSLKISPFEAKEDLKRPSITPSEIYDLTIPYALHLISLRNSMLQDILPLYQSYLILSKAYNLLVNNPEVSDLKPDPNDPKIYPNDVIIEKAIDDFTSSLRYGFDAKELLKHYVKRRCENTVVKRNAIIVDFYLNGQNSEKYDEGIRVRATNWIKDFESHLMSNYGYYDWTFLNIKE